MRSRAVLPFLLLLLLAPPLRGQDPAGPSVRVMGFGDVGYLLTSRDLPEGFLLGQFVGHAVAGLTERLNFFGELSATARPTGTSLELERMILRYDFSDPLKLSLGRYHTPIGYWNTAFHHGSWLHTSVSRPEMIKFGSNFVPTHFVGVLVEGSFPELPLGVGYAVGVGNGRGSTLSRAGDAGDVDGSRAWLAQLTARPSALLGAQVGAGVYFDRAHPAAGGAVDERILSAHFALERETPELIAEYARATHEPLAAAGGAADSEAFYVQLAYRLPGRAQRYKPYLRAERVDVPAGDALLAPLSLNYEAAVAGVRIDPAPFAALKVEYRRERLEAPGSFDSLHLQASFTIPSAGEAGSTPLHHQR